MLKLNQRVKCRGYRGTILSILKDQKIACYSVALEIGKSIVHVKGSEKQFKPVYSRR